MAGEEGRLREAEERYEGYTVYDQRGEKIGKVDELLVDDASGREEYIGVKMGLFGMSGTALVPMEISSVNEAERSVAVAESRDRVKEAPTYDDEVTDELEERVRRHYGLEEPKQASDRGSGEERASLAPGSRRRVRRRVRTEETEELTEEEAASEAESERKEDAGDDAERHER